MVATDEISKMIIFRGNFLQDWIKIERTNPVQKLTQKLLQSKVTRFLISAQASNAASLRQLRIQRSTMTNSLMWSGEHMYTGNRIEKYSFRLADSDGGYSLKYSISQKILDRWRLASNLGGFILRQLLQVGTHLSAAT